MKRCWQAPLALFGLGVGLALLRHVALIEDAVFAPRALLARIERVPVVLELSREQGRAAVERDEYQPVDLRREQGEPIVAGKIAWGLPLPHSVAILDRFTSWGKGRPLLFMVARDERDEGAQVLRAICERLGVRRAALVEGGL